MCIDISVVWIRCLLRGEEEEEEEGKGLGDWELNLMKMSLPGFVIEFAVRETDLLVCVLIFGMKAKIALKSCVFGGVSVLPHGDACPYSDL